MRSDYHYIVFLLNSNITC